MLKSARANPVGHQCRRQHLSNAPLSHVFFDHDEVTASLQVIVEKWRNGGAVDREFREHPRCGSFGLGQLQQRTEYRARHGPNYQKSWTLTVEHSTPSGIGWRSIALRLFISAQS